MPIPTQALTSALEGYVTVHGEVLARVGIGIGGLAER